MARPSNPELVDRIVRVTARMVDEHGIDHVTIRRVGEEAECSTTLIYHYFGSKDGLLHRAVQHGLESFGEFVATSERGLSGIDRVRASARAYVQWGISNQSMYRLMFEQRIPRPANDEELKQRRGGLVMAAGMLRDVLGERAADIDVAQAANIFFVSLHGIVSTSISGRLWGPGLEESDLLDRSIPLTDALVDQWATAWGMSK